VVAAGILEGEVVGIALWRILLTEVRVMKGQVDRGQVDRVTG